jgi:pimeloyl-ACP methyl ester carboxylesterase
MQAYCIETVKLFLNSPLTPTIVYAGTDYGLYKSTDGGTSWNPSNTGLPPNASATALAMMNYPVMNLEAPVAPCLIYNGTDDPPVERARAMAGQTPPSVHYAEIPGVDHAMCFQRSDLVLPIVLPFLSKAARGEVSLAR